MNWKYLAYHSFWLMLDLIFPPICGGCGKPGSCWCVECQNRVRQLNGTLCEICGLPQDKPGICGTCLVERPHFLALRAWVVYSDPIQPALHGLKYRRNISMGDAFAYHMAPFVKSLNWQIDLVIPIPLGRQRLKERGYNQVGMIAQPLALAMGMRYAPNGLVRRKETRSQVGLTKNERKENVQNAFEAGVGIKGKSILILDDVSTTGSTLSAGAEVLYSAGARDVYALTVARALPQHGLKHA